MPQRGLPLTQQFGEINIDPAKSNAAMPIINLSGLDIFESCHVWWRLVSEDASQILPHAPRDNRFAFQFTFADDPNQPPTPTGSLLFPNLSFGLSLSEFREYTDEAGHAMASTEHLQEAMPRQIGVNKNAILWLVYANNWNPGEDYHLWYLHGWFSVYYRRRPS